MSKATKGKIGADVADAIEHAVQKCLDEKLEDIEDEITKKVVTKLNEQDDESEQMEEDHLFNPLGGP